ncbi:hypothetical protein SARC_06124 [Sphaeroforma arctica JP610]|uniref:Uncharacterized protein n=1 Tax=Sphaeroforma arctica JP610 TaxID=667725 RepID=A0A0L0FXN4_9EUKA|nr:hypothetical protein SARC_06124 [Sphaeroforma arctica JP610]KNC81567.1 hypothetical protein SARC_06124 [Sphaeroforma arctica JP610]|eukprot:XP_014155469.1 hypothetical protein SARC_06124 [Sphaeroforma arctica JP610]
MVQQAAYQNRSIHRPHATTSIYDQVEYNRSEPRTPPLRINVDARRLTQQRRDAGSGNRVTVVGQTSRERMTSGSGVQLMRSASIRSSANVNAGPNGDVSLRAILLSESGSARTRTVRRTRPTPVPDAAVANNIRTDTLNSPAGSVVINDNTHSSYIELMRTPNARTLAQTRSDHIAQIERARTGVTVATNAHTGGNIVQPFVPNTPDILHDAMDTSDDDMFIEALIRTDGYHSSQEAEENPRDVLRTALRQSGARSSVPTARDPAVAIETDTSPQSRARGSGEGVVHTSRVPVMSLAQYEAQRHAQISALTAQAQVRPLPYTPYTDTQIQPLPYTDTQIQPLPYTDTQTQPPLQGGESIPARGEGNMRLRDGSINFQSHQFRSRMARAMRTSQIAQQQSGDAN